MTSPARASQQATEVRPFLYAGLDLVFFLVYLVLFWSVVPSSHGPTRIIAWTLIGITLVMAAAMLSRRPWGWRVAAAGCLGMLLLTVALLAYTLASAAFLAGVYGAFGQGASSMTLLAAAVIVEAVGLLPAFQLKFLMTRAGRKSFGLRPKAA
jgi:hypothetical protein